MRRARTAAVLLAVVTLAGCGSTVDPRTEATEAVAGLPAQGGDGLSAPVGPPSGDASPGVPGGPARSSGATSGPGTGSSGGGSSSGGFSGGSGSSGTSTGSGGFSGGSSSSGSSSGRASVRHGIGVTAKEIFVGLTYTSDAEQANRSIGVDVSQGDTKANAEAIIADINERGGVAGRKLVPIFHAYEAQSSKTDAQQDQEACARFTEDNKVFAVMGDGRSDNLRACLLKARVLQVIGGQLYAEDKVTFDANPQAFNLGAPMQDRWFRALVPGLVRQKYFSGWNPATASPGAAPAKVAVIGFDSPMWTRPVPKVLLPALARAGHPVDPDNVVYILAPQTAAEQGPAVAQIQNAALRFAQNGVTHVVFLDTTGGLTLLFATAARNQQYYPRYGVGTTSGLQALYDIGALQERELSGATGIGWNPFIDLPGEASEGFANAKSRACLAMLKKRTGQEYGSTNEATIALSQCDELYVTADTVRGIVGSINLDSARAVLERAGSFPLASMPSAFFSRDKHDGPEVTWDMYWDSPCRCVKYVGAARPLR